MQLQYDTQDAVPEDSRESFVEFKDGENTVFMHKDLAETKKEFYRTKGDFSQYKQKAEPSLSELQELREFKRQLEERQEQDDFENKKKNGQTDEMIEHLRVKSEREKAELQAKLDELNNSVRNEKKAAIVSELASLGTESNRAVLKRLVDADLTFGDDGGLVVLENGKASSLTIDEYKGKLKELYPQLVSESHGRGGQSKGALGSSGSGGVPRTLEECKGDRKLEAEFFNNELLKG